MKTINRVFLLCAFIVIIMGCRKDEIQVTTDDNTLSNTENVEFQFLIISETGNPIQNTQVNINSDLYTSDENGIVLTKAYDIPYLGLRSEFVAEGYLSLMKMINGPKDGKKQEKIVLIKPVTSIISTGSTGTIDGGGSLSLPPSLIRQDGSEYTGEVTVKNKYLDPDSDDFLLSAPGNLLALNGREEFQQLASLGMYTVELFDDNDNALNIPDGGLATLKFPIADKHKNNIESDVPLWYFDEDTGIWKEDGIAKVEGDFMIADVSHFTWWNCDIPYDFTEICFVFLDDMGDPIPGLDVKFSVDGASFGFSQTDVNGSILAKIPVGPEIELTYCIDGVDLGSQNIGTFDENTRKDAINTELNINTISGIAVDCDSNIVTNGYAFFYSNNNIVGVPILEDGSFSFISPGVDFTLFLVDYNNDVISEIAISETTQDIFLDNVVICGEGIVNKVSGTVRIDLDGDNEGDAPLPNALILIRDTDFPNFTSILTNDEGYYEHYLPPGAKFEVTYPGDLQYARVAYGDKSPEGDIISFGKEEFAFGFNGICRGVLDEGEHDADNDFLVIERGVGTISGIFMGDTDNDGIGDLPLEWATIISGSEVNYISVEGDGSFSATIGSGVYHFRPWFNSWDGMWETSDISPDPDGFGYDNDPIFFNVVLYDGEVDEGNVFVIDHSVTRTVLCKVIEDTDNDGIGDTLLEDVVISFKDRDSGSVLSNLKTNRIGIVSYGGVGEDFSKLTIEIQETWKYEVVDLIEESEDNNPFIIGGDLTKMEINLEEGEWDAGNVFVVRKK